LQFVLLFFALGILSIGIAQQVITTTTTTVITLPAETTTTVISQAGTTEVKTIVQGGYRLINVEMKPDQECIIAVEANPVTIVTIPGTTMSPRTITYTIPATTYETTMTKVEGGTTTTRTGPAIITVTTMMTAGPMTTSIIMPVPVYGKIVEYCKVITVTLINRYEASQSQVVTMTFPGYTFSGTVMSLPTVFLTEPVKTTMMTTNAGTTYTMTNEEPAETTETTITKPGTTLTSTIISPGRTLTKTVTYTTTLPEEAITQTSVQQTTQSATTGTMQTAGAEGFPTTMVVAIVAVVAAAVAVALVMRRRAAP